MILITWIFFSSCSSFSTTTTIVVDSAYMHGVKYDKKTTFESKE